MFLSIEEIGIFASEVHELDRADDIVLQQRIDGMYIS